MVVKRAIKLTFKDKEDYSRGKESSGKTFGQKEN